MHLGPTVADKVTYELVYKFHEIPSNFIINSGSIETMLRNHYINVKILTSNMGIAFVRYLQMDFMIAS